MRFWLGVATGVLATWTTWTMLMLGEQWYYSRKPYPGASQVGTLPVSGDGHAMIQRRSAQAQTERARG